MNVLQHSEGLSGWDFSIWIILAKRRAWEQSCSAQILSTWQPACQYLNMPWDPSPRAVNSHKLDISQQCVPSELPVLISYLFLLKSSVFWSFGPAALGAKESWAQAWEVRNETSVFFLLNAGVLEQTQRHGMRRSSCPCRNFLTLHQFCSGMLIPFPQPKLKWGHRCWNICLQVRESLQFQAVEYASFHWGERDWEHTGPCYLLCIFYL